MTSQSNYSHKLEVYWTSDGCSFGWDGHTALGMQRSEQLYQCMLMGVDDGHTERCYFSNPQRGDVLLNPAVIMVLVLLPHRLLCCWHPAVFGDMRLDVASYCKTWNRFPNSYGKQNCEWFVNPKLIISISCIYCVLITGYLSFHTCSWK